MKALLVAEKPDVMKVIKEVYEKRGFKDQIVFKAFRGHVMGLVDADKYDPALKKWTLETLPIIPESFKYRATLPEIVNELNKTIKEGKFDYIINACDADREGAGIFQLYYMGNNIKIPVKRFWCNVLTPDKIYEALNNMEDATISKHVNLAQASVLRGEADWEVGINATRAFSLITGTTVPIGRVMTPTLRIIVERELELQKFVPKTFWEIEADFDKYKGRYIAKEDEENRFFDVEAAKQIINRLGKTGKIISLKKKKESQNPPTLHSLQMLQNEAGKTYGYTLDHTLEIAQKLYEKGILSYPRTDTGFISKEVASTIDKNLQVALLFEDLKEPTGKILKNTKLLQDFVNNKKYVDGSKVGGHDAIRTTGEKVKLEELTLDESNILYLVCKRLVAIFLGPLVTNKTEIITETNGYLFKTNGSVVEDLGYQILYNYQGKDNVLPQLEEGEINSLKGCELMEKKTTPPKRYTVATIGDVMEKAGKFIDDKALSETLKGKGLGTPATRGGIIKKLTTLKMIKLEGKEYKPTAFGIAICKALGDLELTLPELTATWEDKLLKVEDGSYNADSFRKEMREYTKKVTSQLLELQLQLEDKEAICNNTSNKKGENSNKASLGKCPLCENDVVEKNSVYGCSKCNFMIGKTILDCKINKTDIKALLGKKTTKEKTFTWKKTGKKGQAKLKLNFSTGKVEFVFK